MEMFQDHKKNGGGIDMTEILQEAADMLFAGLHLITYDWKYYPLNKTAIHQCRCSNDTWGMRFFDVFPGIEDTPFYTKMKETMVKRVNTEFTNEYWYNEHLKVWYQNRIRPIDMGIIILSLDITEQKKAEMQRQQYLKHMEQVIHMISHEVRQPLAHILGICNVIDGAKTEEERRELLGYMKEAAFSLDKFTRELAAIVRSFQVSEKSVNHSPLFPN